MAVAPIYPVLLIAVITRCRCDHSNGYSANIGNGASRIGELLKPPPPPPLNQILPVPFHGGAGRTQRQNLDIGYQYLPPPPPLLPPLPPASEFKFPSPFYKQYNFNFVPPPQPFSTTPSPSLFQKVSGWLFPSQQTSYDTGTVYSNNNIGVKKDCNPCNLVPWLPVIRYNVGAKNVQQTPISTYGPPSPTANADSQNVVQYRPQHFNNQHVDNKPLQLSPGIPHANYGPPKQAFNSNSVALLSSTYGPPSPTQTIYPQNIQSSTFSGSITSFSIPSSSYGLPGAFNGPSSSSYLPSISHGVSSALFNIPSSTFKSPTSSYTAPSSPFETSHTLSTTYGSVTPNYEPGIINSDLPQQTDIENIDDIEPTNHLKLPKVSQPTSFKNSYGETITDTKIFDIPYPVSATAAESTKIRTEVLPQELTKPNMSVVLANPAPFTSNRGRNIHTLQPVALPNLSVSPLPPIFNARPFRPIKPQFPTNLLQAINQVQQSSNNVKIQQSVPLAEFTHSVDYPTTFIQSPVINIEPSSNINHTKAFRNIPNGYVVDEISSQASEDHVSATKSNPDSSFESTGIDVGNEIYDNGLPTQFSQKSNIPTNHKPNFADLRGLKDEDIDKYRTENNLQNIDSPLLYLKPSAPHKEHRNFFFAISTPINGNEYEMYDDIPTTPVPEIPTLTSTWDESRTDYSDGIPPPTVHEDYYQPKIVQIIVPYTTGKKENNNDFEFSKVPQDWPTSSEDEYQARKVPSNTENYFISTIAENYSTTTVPTEASTQTVTESFNSDEINSAGVLNDLYDVKEPPFDIIKLQHTIDDWTQQEYSKEYKIPQKTRNSEKYAKQIPDDFFTTTMPSNYATEEKNNNYYDFYDHEVSSSIQHSVTKENNETHSVPRKEYNTIQRTKDTYNSKNEQVGESQKPYIYTAASSFRITTTPAPWGKIQTSISPLTKEKVYVVTSKPWRDARNMSNEWYHVEPFESRKTNAGIELPASDNLPFKSPRFMNRPSFGFTSGGKVESAKSDSSYGFSRSWYQSINELETLEHNNSTSLPEVTQQKVTTNLDKDIIAPTAEPHRHG